MNRAAYLGALLAVCGCSASQGLDLSKVRDYAKTTEAARGSFAAIAVDFDASCERSREYLRNSGYSQPPLIVKLGDASLERETAPASAPAGAAVEGSPPPAAFFQQVGLEKCIALTKPAAYPLGAVSNDWNRANAAVLDFVQGIGKIANADTAPKNTPTLTQAIVDANALTSTQATAINAVVASIVGFFSQQTERSDIAAFLGQVSPDFPVAIAGLERVDDAYTEVINAECTITQNFYNRAVRSALNGAHTVRVSVPSGRGKRFVDVELTDVGSATTNQSVLWGRQYAVYKIRSEWRDAAARCQQHLDAAAAYKVVVAKVGSTEQALFDSSHRPLHGKAAFDVIARDAGDLSDAVSNLYALVTANGAGASASAKKK